MIDIAVQCDVLNVRPVIALCFVEVLYLMEEVFVEDFQAFEGEWYGEDLADLIRLNAGDVVATVAIEKMFALGEVGRQVIGHARSDETNVEVKGL